MKKQRQIVYIVETQFSRREIIAYSKKQARALFIQQLKTLYHGEKITVK